MVTDHLTEQTKHLLVETRHSRYSFECFNNDLMTLYRFFCFDDFGDRVCNMYECRYHKPTYKPFSVLCFRFFLNLNFFF